MIRDFESMLKLKRELRRTFVPFPLAVCLAIVPGCANTKSVELGDCRFDIPTSQIVSISDNLQGEIDPHFDRVFEVNIHFSISDLESNLAGEWARAGGAAYGMDVLLANANRAAAVKRYNQLWSDLRNPMSGLSAPVWDDEAGAFRNFWTKHEKSWVLSDVDVSEAQSDDTGILPVEVIAHCHETPSSKVGAFDCLRNINFDGFNASYRIAQQNIEHRKAIDEMIVANLREWERSKEGQHSCFSNGKE
jgi:hypothetical protein